MTDPKWPVNDNRSAVTPEKIKPDFEMKEENINAILKMEEYSDSYQKSREIPDHTLKKIRENIINDLIISFPSTYNWESSSIEDFKQKLREFFKNDPEKLERYTGIIDTNYEKQKKYSNFETSRNISSGLLGIRHEKKRFYHLYTIASFLKKSMLKQEGTIDEIKKILDGKKILILGDDTGSLSEVLNHYGANASGIEYDELQVEIAHSGIMSEDGSPQKQVIRGNIHDLLNDNSSLFKLIKEKGPFDVIYSDAVFNSGSGIEEGISNYKEYGANINNACKKLLSNDGFELHDGVDMYNIFGEGIDDSKKETFGRPFSANLYYIPRSAIK